MNQNTAEGDPVIVHIFTVETKILVELRFTIDFTGSEDIVIENSDNFVVENMV